MRIQVVFKRVPEGIYARMMFETGPTSGFKMPMTRGRTDANDYDRIVPHQNVRCKLAK